MNVTDGSDVQNALLEALKVRIREIKGSPTVGEPKGE